MVTENLAKQFNSHEMVVLGPNHIFSSRGRSEVRANGIRYYYQRTEVNINGRGDRFFVPIRYLLFPFLVWRICSVFRREKCTNILANFPDIYYCYAALLASRLLNAKFSSYFHNTYLENRPNGAMHFFAKRWQPKIFLKSENIFVMSDGMKNYYKKVYGNGFNFVVLPHAYDTSQLLTGSRQTALKPPFKLAFIGNFNESNIDATRRVVNALKADEKCQLYFYTPVPNFLLKMRGIDVDRIIYKGYVDDEKFKSELQQCDVCILTHGFTGGYTDVEYKTIFPTRTIPFLLSGTPIFAHSPAGSFLSDFIKQNGCAYLVEEPSEEAIRTGLNEILTNERLRKELVKNAETASKHFEGKSVSSKLKLYLNKGN